MTLKNKLLMSTLVGVVALCGYQLVNTSIEQGSLFALVDSTADEYTGLTASYFKVEGKVGDVLEDFVVDYKGKSVTDYTITSNTDSLEKVDTGIKLVKEGKGNAQVSYNNVVYNFEYVVELTEEQKKQQSEQVNSGGLNGSTELGKNEKPTIDYKTCTITANGKPCSGMIMYIDDSKNAFKTTGSFFIQKEFLDGKTHSIYIAKFTTNSGPVAYKVTEFTSLAGEVSFLNYNESEVEISNLTINLKTDLNNLF